MVSDGIRKGGFRGGADRVKKTIAVALLLLAGGTLRAQQPGLAGSTYRVTDFPGDDAGVKMKNCILALPSTGGTCFANLEGNQDINQDVFSGIAAQGGILYLGDAVFSTSVTQNIPSGWTIEGVRGGRRMAHLGSGTGTVFKWTGAVSTPVIQIENSSNIVLRNFTVWCNGVAGSIGVKFYATPGGDNNMLRVENVNLYDFQDTGFLWGTGGAGGADGSGVVLDGLEIDGARGNTTAKGIVINSTAAGFGQIKGGYIRRTNKGIYFQYSAGQVTIDSVIFGDPTGGAPNGGASATTPNAIEITRIDRPITLRNIYLESSLSTPYNDVRWRSIYGGSRTYLFGSLLIEGSGLHFPSEFTGPVRISSINNTWAYGPAVLDNAFASVISTGDSVAYWGGFATSGWPSLSSPVRKGTVAVPSVANGHYYRCSVAGAKGGAEPVWPVGDGDTVIDGGVTWTEVGLYTGTGESWIAKSTAAKVVTVGSH
jgi:hypothetical protein